MAIRVQAALSRAGINTAGPQLYWQLRSTTTVRLRVIEIGISISVAPTTAPLFQISRQVSASLGTASTSQTGQMFDSADGSSGAGVGMGQFTIKRPKKRRPSRVRHAARR